MSGPLVIRIPGVAAPQGSKTGIVGADGRARLLEAGSATGRAKHRAWRTAVTLAAAAAVGRQRWPRRHDGPVSVHVIISLPAPRSRRVKTVALATTKPDVDKLARSILDSLTDADVWTDDSRVVELRIKKLWTTGEPHALVTVTPMEDAA